MEVKNVCVSKDGSFIKNVRIIILYNLESSENEILRIRQNCTNGKTLGHFRSNILGITLYRLKLPP